MVHLLIFIILKISFLCVLGLYVYDAGNDGDVIAETVLILQAFTCLLLPPAKVLQGYFYESLLGENALLVQLA